MNTCSECGAPIPSLRGTRPRKTCGPVCSKARSVRHATRYKPNPGLCSECGESCPASPARPFLTCSPECAWARNARLKAENYASRAERGVAIFCIDCTAEMQQEPGKRRTRRCPRCAAVRRLALSRERGKRRRAAKPDRQVAPAPPRERLDNRLRSQYGITLAHYEAMSEAQRGFCAVCGLSPVGRGKGDSLVVDHCHKRGHVRGLLCGNCNIALGLMNDDPEIIGKAKAYVRHWSLVEVES